MKKIVLFLALFCAATLSAQTLSTQYKHINWTWAAPATSTGITGYTLTITDPNGTVVTVPNINTPSLSWTPGTFLTCGTYTGSVVANYGSNPDSTAATGSVVVSCPLPSNPPTNLRGVPAS